MTKNKNLVIYFFSIILILFSFIAFPISNITFANTDNYSNVIVDLELDETFDVNNYPVNEEDNSLQVIQIAETTGKELLIYVYQPSAKYTATSISFSTSIGENFNNKLYDLTLLNSAGTLYKYKVNDFEVKSDALRYYEMVSIYRKWDENVDQKPEGDNTIDEVAFSIAKLYTASTVEGQVSYTCSETEVITITGEILGFVRYSNGFKWYASSCDSHYVAFSTDKQIDNLLQAKVGFISKEFSVTDSIFGDFTDYRDEKYQEVFLKSGEEANNPGGGLFAENHTWLRIEKVEDFIKNEDLTSEAKNDLNGKQWILRFYESAYTKSGGMAGTTFENGRTVSEVTILQLTFETEGTIYNLGVVDNKKTGTLDPDNESSWLKDLLTTFLTIVLGAVLVITFFPYIIKVIFSTFSYLAKGIVIALKYLGVGIQYLFIGIWTIISFPVQIFKKRGGE